jgi:flagellar basal-body rod protein FlgF
VLSSVTNFTQGDLISTGNPLDLALKGEGFFTVKLNGTDTMLYTRSGNFTMDDAGFLTTTTGDRVQGLNGDIQIPRGTSKVEISPIGEVIANNQAIDRLVLAQFDDNQALKRIGSNYYQAIGQTPNPAVNLTVEQGALERANTNVITELVNSMTGLRIYEMLQKSVQMQSETLNKSVNDVGRVT